MSRTTSEELRELVERLQELQLETTTVTERIAELLEAESEAEEATRPVTPPRPFVRISERARDYLPGDRVYITNRVGHAGSRGVTSGDRAATVTGALIPDRVDFRTIRGYNTWRKAKNLKRLTEEEFQAFRNQNVRQHNAGSTLRSYIQPRPKTRREC